MEKDNPTLKELKPYFENSECSAEAQIYHYDRELPKHIKNPEKWVFSWNWSAALFSDLWMIYRKMYWQGLLTFFVTWGSGLIISHYYIEVDSIIDILMTYFLTFFIFGSFGNALYYRDLKHRIAKGFSRKGVNVGGVFALLAIAVILELSIFGF